MIKKGTDALNRAYATMDGFDEDWIKGCHQPPRAKGLCMEHYQMKYHKGWYKKEK